MPLFEGGVQDDNPTNPTAFRSWDDICQTKENGGLGIMDFIQSTKAFSPKLLGTLLPIRTLFLPLS
jgi:hypothetical protein